MSTKFKRGDKVKIVNYGHQMINKYEMVDGKAKLILGVFDINPGIVGKIGIIEKAERNQKVDYYAIGGIPEKHAWYLNDQLELVERPDYNM